MNFLLEDRLTKIQSVINKYGEDNFYISFSGGKDSCVLSALIDMALPENKIPRVYANTGIELNKITEFVSGLTEKDDRFIIIKPKQNIKDMLERVGYPFKSKYHSHFLEVYQKYNTLDGRTGLQHYLGVADDKQWSKQYCCPEALKYQFTPNWQNSFKISNKCCNELKKKPMKEYSKTHNRPININGIMRDEGGQREHANCLAFHGNKLTAFQPLSPLTKEWEDWFIKTYNVELCELYNEPYNFVRTGCKGCPFALDLQKELDTLDKHFPNERKQCELIWKPVYTEYRRIGYRLRKDDEL